MPQEPDQPRGNPGAHHDQQARACGEVGMHGAGLRNVQLAGPYPVSAYQHLTFENQALFLFHMRVPGQDAARLQTPQHDHEVGGIVALQ